MRTVSGLEAAVWVYFLSNILFPVSATAVLESRAAASSAPQPYSVPVSQYWDGDDGPWSTFSFQVGNPFQQVRLLPATSGKTFAPILQSGCNENDTNTCATDRGFLFNPNGSSTWSSIGTYTYTTPYSQEAQLGDLANAVDGQDQIQLSWPGSNGPILTQQLVTSIADKGIFYLGSFGLSPRPTNISSQNNEYTSPLTALVNAKQIPSNTYGYNAGFHGSDKPAYGSLTLGGYDTSRFRANSVSFPFGPDISRDLLVGIQRVTCDSSNSPLLPDPIYAFIDSTISTLYLPTPACRAFEKAFNLTYSADGNFYPLTTTQHSALLAANPTITFTLGASLAGGATVSIALPYAAFDQTTSPPLGTEGLRYFPLQRADNSSQYALGRTFLQQAYLIADYDRQNFSVSQALFPQGVAAQVPLTPIYMPGYVAPATKEKKGVSGGAIAGIVLGVVLVLLLVAGAVFFFLRSRRSKRASGAGGAYTSAPDGRHNSDPAAPPYTSDTKTAELQGAGEAGEPRKELDGRSNGGWKNELPGGETRAGKSELADAGTGGPMRVEMEGGQGRIEMDATDDGKKDWDGREKVGGVGGGGGRGGRGRGTVYELA